MGFGFSGLPLNAGAAIREFLADPTSAKLAAAVSDETGSAVLLFGTAPASCTIGISFGGAAVGVTYGGGAQVAQYQRIGNIIRVQFYIGLTSKGSSTGAARLTGLPVASANAAYNYGATSTIIGAANLSGLTAAPIIGQVGPNSTTAELVQQAATATAALADTNFTDTSVITGCLDYFV